ncbi:hypothetical protein VTK26DRAFT_6545 [Humicola hyalothermophila]
MASEHKHTTSETERGDGSDAEEVPCQSEDEGRPKSPAHVAPIPKIGSIPPVAPAIHVSPADRPHIPTHIGSYLVGKLVNEDGDIIDDATSTVLARAGGDLPSIVGKRVSNSQGDILGGEDGNQLLGYVAELEVGKQQNQQPQRHRSLLDLMGRATSSLMVDDQGNILDATGQVVGRFHDNNNPLHHKEKEEREALEREERQRAETETLYHNHHQEQQPQEQPQSKTQPEKRAAPNGDQDQNQDQGQRRPSRRTEEERRQNAEDWRKENPGESPSDIFLDVKSTTEGVQLTIRIPTVFNGQQRTPHISFS